MSFHCHLCIVLHVINCLVHVDTSTSCICTCMHRLVSSSFLYLILFVFLSFRDQLDLCTSTLIWTAYGIPLELDPAGNNNVLCHAGTLHAVHDALIIVILLTIPNFYFFSCFCVCFLLSAGCSCIHRLLIVFIIVWVRLCQVVPCMLFPLCN